MCTKFHLIHAMSKPFNFLKDMYFSSMSCNTIAHYKLLSSMTTIIVTFRQEPSRGGREYTYMVSGDNQSVPAVSDYLFLLPSHKATGSVYTDALIAAEYLKVVQNIVFCM